MKKLADFIVNNKYKVLITVLIITVICAALAFTVRINTDMTLYLPDDSSMKKGIDLMAEEFPDMEVPKTIRVMFEDMTKDETAEMLTRLETLEYVSSVDFDAASEDHYKDGYALFILNTDYDYGSPEERSIEKTIKSEFDEHNMLFKNDNTVTTEIPPLTIIVAVLLILIVLTVMGTSWFEPVLFIAAIGCAVIINLGTNFILGSVSYITFAMAALLQMVLSMDYSVILVSRYRQELTLDGDRPAAMKRALVNAFSSITASSVTTFVGLFALVFMSFKIGADLGIVLAKGVVCSLLSVFTVMPALILRFDGLIEKTAKKGINIRMNRLSKFSYRGRHVLTALFIPLFIAMFFMQQKTDIVYTLNTKDPIAEIFPKTSTLVILYNNKDEAKIAELSDKMSDDKKVKTVLNYSTTLGRQHTVEELSGMLDELVGNTDIDPSLLRIIYYEYFDGSVASVPVGDFLNFIANDVATNRAFKNYISDDMRGNLDLIRKFSSAEALTTPQSAAYIADLLGIGKEQTTQLIMYYYVKSGADSGVRMTVNDFISFVQNDVANNPEYDSMIDGNYADSLSRIAVLTDKEKLTTPTDPDGAAAMLGLDPDVAEILFLLYSVETSAYTPSNMNVVQFAAFVASDILTNPAFTSNMDADILSTLKNLTDPEALKNLPALTWAIVSGEKQTPERMAELLGMDARQVKLIYAYHDYKAGALTLSNPSLYELLSFLVDNPNILAGMVSDAELSGLKTARNIAEATINGESLSANEMAALLGMSESDINGIYLLYASKNHESYDLRVSVRNFIDFLDDSVLSDPQYADSFDSASANQLKSARRLVDAVADGEFRNAASMATLLSGFGTRIDTGTMDLLCLLYAGANYSDPGWKLSILDLFDFISDDFMNDARFAGFMTEDIKSQIIDYKSQIDSGLQQLVGKKHSIFTLYSLYPAESAETTKFFNELTSWCDKNLGGDYYLIGDSAMSYEMSLSFDREFWTITLLTALAIFIVILLTFRNFFVPLILVALVQCGVFQTVTLVGLQGYSIYYLALLIVQCILMGATVDYGILFTSYYREMRETMSIRDSIKAAYEGSIHTILTSGSIMVFVCALVAPTFSEPTVYQICSTLSIGAFCVILLIIFILPCILATLDKLVCRAKRYEE